MLRRRDRIRVDETFSLGIERIKRDEKVWQRICIVPFIAKKSFVREATPGAEGDS